MKLVFGCFLKWWYPQNTPKWSFLVGKPMVVGYHHFRKPPFQQPSHISETMERPKKTTGNRGRGCSSQSFPEKTNFGHLWQRTFFSGKDRTGLGISSPASCPYGSFNTVDGRNPANHLGSTKPCKRMDILPINWCRISSINNMFADIPLLGMTFGKKHFKYTSDQLLQSLGRYLWTMASWCFQPFWKISITLDHFPYLCGWKWQKCLSCHHLHVQVLGKITTKPCLKKWGCFSHHPSGGVDVDLEWRSARLGNPNDPFVLDLQI